MNNNPKLDEEWEPLQIKVFSRWVSKQLRSIPNSNIQDVTKDLSNGVALVELAEILTHKRAKRLWEHQPTKKVENVQNCDLAIDMFSNDGVKLVGISGKDVSDNNKKLILGLIWSLILHYSVGHSTDVDKFVDNKINNHNLIENKRKTDPETELISWAVNRTKEYKNIDYFQPYDLAMCALLDSYYPDKIKFNSLDVNDHQNNAKLAFNVMKELGIFCYIYPDDLSNNGNKVDRMTLITQLAAAKSVLDNVNKSVLINKAALNVFTTAEEQKVKDEESKVRAQLKEEEEARLKAKEEEDRKIKEEQKTKEIIETRLRVESILKAKHEEENFKKEMAAVKEANKTHEKEVADKIKEDEEAKRKADLAYAAKVEAEKKLYDKHPTFASLVDEKPGVDINKIQNEADSRVKSAEARAEAAEKEKEALEEKLKAAEIALKKAQDMNEDHGIQSKDVAVHDDHHKEKNYKIHIRIHPHEDQPKKYKVQIKLKDHNHQNHVTVKNVHIVERKNGHVVPTEVEGETVDGKQVFHVKEV